ncbi:hypothetical protein FKP32DRAFT_1590412 [Trametes sanguinea]|nr:hypothetical protein FKP32DRAFT_1590412 [Trametes sanguinea]
MPVHCVWMKSGASRPARRGTSRHGDFATLATRVLSLHAVITYTAAGAALMRQMCWRQHEQPLRVFASPLPLSLTDH